MYNVSDIKRTARAMSWVCGSLFALFSFLYLYMMQADLLSVAQHLLSKGQTVYSPLVGAGIITIVLLLLKYGYRSVVVYPVKFYALYYFPSSLILGLLTSLIPLDDTVAFSVNWAVFVCYICIYLLIVWMVMHFPDRANARWRKTSVLWVNFLLLAVQFCMIASIANTNDVYHYRLRAEKHIVAGEDAEVLKVGVQSLKADRSLTAIRAFALSRSNQLGDKLFEYPQYFGSNGLMPDTSDTMYVHGWVKQFYAYLGGRPGKTITSPIQFFELLTRMDSVPEVSHDYLLCGYLLDKDLDSFAKTLPKFYKVDENLPLYYKEAMVLYCRLHTTPAVVYKNAVVETNLSDFIKFGTEYSNMVERSNRCRRMYGNTYWWYYYYQISQ